MLSSKAEVPLFTAQKSDERKSRKMIDKTNEIDKGLENALKALEQAKQRVANEKNRMRKSGKPGTTTSTTE